MKKIVAITIFNLIEALAFFGGVGAWFVLHDAGQPLVGALVGTLIWTIITQVEHITAFNTGAGRPFLNIPKD